jgi:N-glycosidase YbiA
MVSLINSIDERLLNHILGCTQLCQARLAQRRSSGCHLLRRKSQYETSVLPINIVSMTVCRVTGTNYYSVYMQEIPPDRRILYFSRDRQTFGFLSHFWPAPVVIDGGEWPTVEHYYQSQKSADPGYRDAIRQAATPAMAKRLAAQPHAPRRISHHSWFRANATLPREDWFEVKLDIMRRADHAKFIQHPDLAAALLATEDAQLVEDSPFDPYWGIGRDGQGLNWAGRVLMEIRQELAAAS